MSKNGLFEKTRGPNEHKRPYPNNQGWNKYDHNHRNYYYYYGGQGYFGDNYEWNFENPYYSLFIDYPISYDYAGDYPLLGQKLFYDNATIHKMNEGYNKKKQSDNNEHFNGDKIDNKIVKNMEIKNFILVAVIIMVLIFFILLGKRGSCY